MDDSLLKILVTLALVVGGLAIELIRRHGRSCKELQQNYQAVQDGMVPRTEFNQTTQSLRGEMNRNVERLRDEIREGYRHIELRIDQGNSETHKRIDRLAERRDNGRNHDLT